MKNYSFTQEDLEVLRKALPHGTQKKIASKLNVSPNLVARVLRGTTYSARIIDEALKEYRVVIKKQDQQLKIFKEINIIHSS